MIRAALSIAVLLSLGCGALEDPCRFPEPGSYRVQWLTTPPDCPFLDQPGRIELALYEAGSCFFWDGREERQARQELDEDACGLTALPHRSSCGYPIASGYAVVEAEHLTQVAPGRFRGPATAWVDDLTWTDSFSTARRCEGGTLELALEPDSDPAAPASAFDVGLCDPAANDCPKGTACRTWPGTPWGACQPDPWQLPEEGQACLTRCASGLVCQYFPGEPHDGIGTCRTPARATEPCRDNADPDQPYSCSVGAYCDAQRICRLHPALGEACEIDLETCRTEPCTSDAVLATCFDGYCAPQPEEPSVCRPFKQRGEPCALSQVDNRIECDSGLLCICTETDCTSGVCLELRFADERCDDPEVICYEPLQCVQGVCR